MTSTTQDDDYTLLLSPIDNEPDYLRADSPLVIEDDDDLTSFLQRETSLDPSSSALLPDDASGHATSRETDGHALPRLTFATISLTLTTCISGLLFGYDTGVISSTLVTIGTALTQPDALSTLDKSLITSCTSLFALLASPIGGWLADRWGRRSMLYLSNILFIVGALLQACAYSVTAMVVGRSIVGIAVGVASLVVPLYISELAPPAIRGRLVVVNVLFITGGQMLAYFLGWRLAELPAGWRYMVGTGAAPAAIQLFCLPFLPETPRWLVRRGRGGEARHVLTRTYGQQASVAVDATIKAIRSEVMEEDEALMTLEPQKGTHWLSLPPAGWNELFNVPGNRRALIIACLLQGLQQLCGFNALMYFSASIFAEVGFRSPILASLSVAVTNFVFTVVAMTLIDRIGRRRVLVLTIPVMCLGLLLAAAAFFGLGSEGTTIIFDGNAAPVSRMWPTVILVAIVIYVAAYATGLGNVPWQQSELFPLNVRSVGCGLSTATAWSASFVIGLTFLPFMKLLHPSWTFVLYAAICLVGWLLVDRIYPETKGLGLEEVSKLLRDGWGVERRSVRTE